MLCRTASLHVPRTVGSSFAFYLLLNLMDKKDQGCSAEVLMLASYDRGLSAMNIVGR